MIAMCFFLLDTLNAKQVYNDLIFVNNAHGDSSLTLFARHHRSQSALIPVFQVLPFNGVGRAASLSGLSFHSKFARVRVGVVEIP